MNKNNAIPKFKRYTEIPDIHVEVYTDRSKMKVWFRAAAIDWYFIPERGNNSCIFRWNPWKFVMDKYFIPILFGM